jgi:hypothetical protein
MRSLGHGLGHNFCAKSPASDRRMPIPAQKGITVNSFHHPYFVLMFSGSSILLVKHKNFLRVEQAQGEISTFRASVLFCSETTVQKFNLIIINSTSFLTCCLKTDFGAKKGRL